MQRLVLVNFVYKKQVDSLFLHVSTKKSIDIDMYYIFTGSLFYVSLPKYVNIVVHQILINLFS